MHNYYSSIFLYIAFLLVEQPEQYKECAPCLFCFSFFFLEKNKNKNKIIADTNGYEEIYLIQRITSDFIPHLRSNNNWDMCVGMET